MGYRVNQSRGGEGGLEEGGSKGKVRRGGRGKRIGIVHPLFSA